MSGNLAGRTTEHGRIDAPGHPLPVARAAEETPPLRDDLPAQQGHDGPAGDRPPFPGAVVRHVEVVLGERLADRRIDEHQVGVAARRDHALLWIEAPDLCGTWRGGLREA